MIGYFKRAFETTNKNMALAVMLVTALFAMSLYLALAGSAADNLFKFALGVVTLLFMFGAFGAGWFYAVKQAVENKNIGMDIWKSVPDGVGRYFLSFLGLALLGSVLMAAFAAGVFWFGTTVFGTLDIDPEMLKQAMVSPEGMMVFVNSLTQPQLMQLSAWNLLVIVAGWVFSFFTMFWMPEIVYNTPNPAKAFVNSLKNLFTNPVGALTLFFSFTAMNFVLSSINALAAHSLIAYALMMAVYFYFITYVVVLIFTYYAKNYSNNRANSQRQE